MTCQYPDLGGTSDWSCRVGNLIQPRHQYGISVLVFQTSFGGETTGSVDKCRLFSQARKKDVFTLVPSEYRTCTRTTVPGEQV